jgi:hypothetical protein
MGSPNPAERPIYDTFRRLAREPKNREKASAKPLELGLISLFLSYLTHIPRRELPPSCFCFTIVINKRDCRG